MNVLKTLRKAPFRIIGTLEKATLTATCSVVAVALSFCLSVSAQTSALCDTCCTKVPENIYPKLALRSNLLMPLLNVGVELPLDNHWSLGADYYYPWQPRNANHKNCFQLIFASGEARYWFGKRPRSIDASKLQRLLGHSVAVYGAWGYYDFEHKWHGRQGDFWSAGADYIYAKPICNGKLHIEFQLAIGYIHSQSQLYDVFYKGGHLIREKNLKKDFNYVGPTKVGVSLVLPIMKKGGSR